MKSEPHSYSNMRPAALDMEPLSKDVIGSGRLASWQWWSETFSCSFRMRDTFVFAVSEQGQPCPQGHFWTATMCAVAPKLFEG